MERRQGGRKPPPRAGTKILKVLCPLICLLLHPTILLGGPDTPDGGPAWEMPRTYICFTCYFIFSKAVHRSDPQPHTLPGRIRDRWGIKVLPNPQIPTKAEWCLFHVFRGWIGLSMVNHNFWDNTSLI